MDFNNASPIWLQLVTEFSRRIVVGQWPPGERIAGVRELALELKVNPNTVQRALAELERQGLCRSERTSGRFVTDDARRVNTLRRELVAQAADDYVRRGRGFGIELADATDLLRERWNSHDTTGTHIAAAGGK